MYRCMDSLNDDLCAPSVCASKNRLTWVDLRVNLSCHLMVTVLYCLHGCCTVYVTISSVNSSILDVLALSYFVLCIILFCHC